MEKGFAIFFLVFLVAAKLVGWQAIVSRENLKSVLVEFKFGPYYNSFEVLMYNL